MKINWSLFWTITFAIIASLSILFLFTGLLRERNQEISNERFEKRKRIGFNGDPAEPTSEPVSA
jgi:hypothetical protein